MAKGISNFLEVLFRLQELGIKNQSQLSRVLGISPGGVSDAKKRGNFPKGWAVKLAQKYSKSVDWVLCMEQSRQEISQENTYRDENMRLMRTIIKQNEDMAEQKRVYNEALQAANEKITSLQSQLLSKEADTTKKKGQDYFNQLETKMEKKTQESITKVG